MIAEAGFVRASGRADARRAGDHPFGLEDLTTSVTHLWRLLKWGRTLARHGALRGIEEDPADPAACAPARPDRAVRARMPKTFPNMRPRWRRSARRRSSSARRCPLAPTWSARSGGGTTCSQLQDDLPPAPSRRSRRRSSASFDRRSRACSPNRSGPVGAASIAQVHRAVTTEGRRSRSRCSVRASRTSSRRPSRPTNGPPRMSRRSAARPCACGPGSSSPISSSGPPRARPSARGGVRLRAAREHGRRARLLRPRDRLAANGPARAYDGVARRDQAQRPRGADRRRPRLPSPRRRSSSAPSCARRWSTASSTPTCTTETCSRLPTAASRRSTSASWAGSTGAPGSGWPRSSTA